MIFIYKISTNNDIVTGNKKTKTLPANTLIFDMQATIPP
jgi:hypothetical protein